MTTLWIKLLIFGTSLSYVEGNSTTTISSTTTRLYPPSVDIKPSYNPFFITIDDKAPNLVCEANSSEPITQRIWYHNGSQVSSGLTYTSSETGIRIGGTHQCVASNIAGSGSDSIVIVVQYGPTIKPLTNRTISEFSDLVVTCSAISNPMSTFYWTRITDSSFRQNGPQLRINNIVRSFSDTYTCHAANTLRPSTRVTSENKTDSKSLFIDVQYSTKIQLLPSYDPYITYEGQTGFQITCKVTEGNPVPSVKWFDTQNTTITNSRMLSLSSITRSSGGKYYCVAQNAVSITSALAEVKVQYAPELSSISDKTINEDSTLSVPCSASADPPVSRYWWTLPNDNVQDSDRLNIPQIKRSQSGEYTCNAQNVLTPSGKSNITKTKTTSINVDVQYGPGSSVVLSPSDKHINLTEGSPLSRVTCSAICNPSCSFRWNLHSTRKSNNQYISINNINRKDAGIYVCEAYNKVSSWSANFTVTVLYKPDITSVSFSRNIEENGDTVLTCTVDSVPESDIQIEFNESQIYYKSSTTSAVYRISKASCLHTGNYVCLAKNEIGNSTSKSAFLNVYCKPRRDARIQQSKDARVEFDEERKALNISIRIIANPKPQMSWAFRDKSSRISSISQATDDIQIEDNFKPPIYNVILYKYNFTSADEGEYIVTFRNSYGENIYNFFTTVQPQSSTTVVAPVVGGTLSAIAAIVVILVVVFLYRRKQLCFKENSCQIGFKFKHEPKERKLDESDNSEGNGIYENSAFEETLNNLKKNPKIKVKKNETVNESTDPSENYQDLRTKSARIYATPHSQQTVDSVEEDKPYSNVELAKSRTPIYQNVGEDHIHSSQVQKQANIEEQVSSYMASDQPSERRDIELKSRSGPGVPKVKTALIPKSDLKQKAKTKEPAGFEKGPKPRPAQIKSADPKGKIKPPDTAPKSMTKEQQSSVPLAVPKIKQNVSENIRAKLKLLENKIE